MYRIAGMSAVEHPVMMRWTQDASGHKCLPDGSCFHGIVLFCSSDEQRLNAIADQCLP